MILLASIANRRAAQAFVDYLTLHHCIAKLVPGTSEESAAPVWQIWVDEEQTQQAQMWFEEFKQNPNDKKYLEASWQVGQPQTNEGQSFGFARIWRTAGGLTRFVTLLCVSIYCLSLFGFYGQIRSLLSFSWDLSEFYRLITPIFMHLSAMHIVFNLCWWWYLGGRIERVLGKQTLLLIVLISALASNIAQATLVNVYFAGLSGVVYALAGFSWYCGAFYQSKSIQLPNNIFVFLLVWMLIGFMEVLPIAMANWAHLFGLLSGLLMARILVKPEPQTTQ